MRDLSADRELMHFSLNTGTVRAQGDFLAIVEAAKRHGISQISPWREQVAAVGLERAVKAVRDAGFTLSGYCRGGLFPADAARRQAVRDDNRRAVDEALALGAPCLVIVAGGLPQYTREGSAPSKDIAAARAEIHDGLAELLDYAQTGGMPLALEPLHPMMAAERCAVNTLRQALDLCDDARSRPLARPGAGGRRLSCVVGFRGSRADQAHRARPPACLPRLRLAGSHRRQVAGPRHDGRRRHRDRQIAREHRSGSR